MLRSFVLACCLAGCCWQATAQDGGDASAPVQAMLTNAAGLVAVAPRLAETVSSEYNFLVITRAIPVQATGVQNGVLDVYRIVRGVTVPGGTNPSEVRRQFRLLASGATDPRDLIAALQKQASDLQAATTEFTTLVSQGRTPNMVLLDALTTLRNKITDLTVSLSKASQLAAGVHDPMLRVPPDGDLQLALDLAQSGDTILLSTGTVYSGNFRLRAKTGSGWITLTTVQPERLPAAGVRLTPALASGLPQLVTPNQLRALEADPGAHHYRIAGLEIRPAAGLYPLGLAAIGQTDNPQAEFTPHDFVLEHLYIHGDPVAGAKYGLRLEAAQVTLSDSTIADIKSDFQDSQAVTGCNGPGPFLLVNNHLEAAGENVMWGSCGSVAGVIPSDITMRGNYLYKPLAWKDQKWAVKNSFEVKNGQRIRMEGNVFENNWVSAQAGFMVQLTPRMTDTGTPGVVRDITFLNNVFKNSPLGVNILGQDDTGAGYPGQARNLTFQGNLFTGFGDPALSAKLFQLLGPVQQVSWDHNTMLTASGAWLTCDTPVPGSQITNNILTHADYGVWGPNSPIDLAAIQIYLPGVPFTNNVVIGGRGEFPAHNLAAANISDVGFLDLTGYALSATSRFAGLATNGTDPGINSAVVSQLAAAVVAGTAH